MTVRIIQPADVDKDTHYGENIDYLEYGIQLPNGTILWTGGFYRPVWTKADFPRLNLQLNQDRVQRDYAEHLERQGIPYEPEKHRLRFVSRRQQIRFTEPESLVGEELQEFQQSVVS